MTTRHEQFPRELVELYQEALREDLENAQDFMEWAFGRQLTLDEMSVLFDAIIKGVEAPQNASREMQAIIKVMVSGDPTDAFYDLWLRRMARQGVPEATLAFLRGSNVQKQFIQAWQQQVATTGQNINLITFLEGSEPEVQEFFRESQQEPLADQYERAYTRELVRRGILTDKTSEEFVETLRGQMDAGFRQYEEAVRTAELQGLETPGLDAFVRNTVSGLRTEAETRQETDTSQVPTLTPDVVEGQIRRQSRETIVPGGRDEFGELEGPTTVLSPPSTAGALRRAMATFPGAGTPVISSPQQVLRLAQLEATANQILERLRSEGADPDFISAVEQLLPGLVGRIRQRRNDERTELLRSLTPEERQQNTDFAGGGAGMEFLTRPNPQEFTDLAEQEIARLRRDQSQAEDRAIKEQLRLQNRARELAAPKPSGVDTSGLFTRFFQ